MMSMQSRNQYLQALIKNNGGYHLKSKGEKAKVLDQFCKVTGQNRKYVIRKIRRGSYILQERKKQIGQQRIRQSYYDRQIIPALIRCWEIFEFPCGRRLETSLREEVDRLRKQKELTCSDSVAKKLKQISARTIDEKLKPHKEKERRKQKYTYRNNPLLYRKIPIKLFDEWRRQEIGGIQIDLVEHCGQSNRGEFSHTLSTTDVNFGWWEGGVQLNRGQKATTNNIKKIRKRYPFDWTAIHSDNDTAFINQQLFAYAQNEDLDFSRSRPYHKNDNCLVEQKNSTHVRRCVGHYRYDTKKEAALLNELYANELRLYKNFFQPVMKLISKERIGGHVKRKYDKAKTPYRRIMESPKISQQTKQELTKIYESLNPAQLKRDIDEKLKILKKLYDAKQQRSRVEKLEKLNLNTVTFLNRTTKAISVT